MERLESNIKNIIELFEAGGYRMRDRTKIFVTGFMEWHSLDNGATDHDKIPIVKYKKIDDNMDQLLLADRDFIVAQVDIKKNILTVTEPDDVVSRTILNYVLVINKKVTKYSIRAFPPKTNESKKIKQYIKKLNLKL